MLAAPVIAARRVPESIIRTAPRVRSSPLIVSPHSHTRLYFASNRLWRTDDRAAAELMKRFYQGMLGEKLSPAAALRAALRENPDVILVGEMRDLETIGAAITAAETGHLVFGTLHTSSAAKTIDRIVDVFPAAEKEMVRAMLSESLVAVISQSLCKLKDGSGRVAAHEIMLGTAAIRMIRAAGARGTFGTHDAALIAAIERIAADSGVLEPGVGAPHPRGEPRIAIDPLPGQDVGAVRPDHQRRPRHAHARLQIYFIRY